MLHEDATLSRAKAMDARVSDLLEQAIQIGGDGAL